MKTLLVILCVATVAYADERCESMGGTCQLDSLACVNGHYRSGLCSGGADRRCCVPSIYCGDVQVITRAQWEARDPISKSTMPTPVDLSFIHHTAGNSCYNIDDCCAQMRSIQNYHMNDNGWNDIGYSFLIGEDGNAYEGRGWGVEGAHTSGYNDVSHGMSFMGTYMSRLPNTAAMDACYDLLQCGKDEGFITRFGHCIQGHRDAGTTSCPGDALYNDMQSWPEYC
ncbi:peptidoglycan recognition protein 1-like [Saccoglossus kowalevskii]|uniref:Peptidoglycan recognition protein 1-like n=1 Tax=Saccoglossus kowalevskii TaxID=10224 RepID=A0ABM0GIE1_SACKO|nr:PREDICTED: peptidoglycan recognition protein 1-like [Saccoglossus kowalevskii]